ncbi:MAG: T9SS type A sorting domain-containing protein [Ignavibacteriales bacterium]|nr:T9SS type A sorting domain-containing protein [Ignavibacteriales bacterium]
MTSATIAAGGNQQFFINFVPNASLTGDRSGSLVITHNANNVIGNTTIVPFTAALPSASASSTLPVGGSATITLGSTGLSLRFSNTGSGGTLTGHRIPSFSPGPISGGRLGTSFHFSGTTHRLGIVLPLATSLDNDFQSASGAAGVSVDIDFPNPGGSDALLARRPVDSPAGTTWDVIPVANTAYSSGTITATSQGSVDGDWVVLLPGAATPTLTTLSVVQGSKGGNYNVILTGTNFITDSLSVSFGAGVTVNTTTLTSATEVVVNITVSATAAAGTRDVVLKQAGGTVTKTAAFSVVNAAPTVVSASPTSGAKGATLDVVLTGTGFETGVTSVSFGTGITVNLLTVTSATQATANVTISGTATTGTRDVIVTNAAPGGGSVTLTGGFTVGNLAPTVASLNPTSGAKGSKLNFSITGTNFSSGVTTAVSFGAGITVNSFAIVSATQITGNITIDAAATTGLRDIMVTNTTPGGGTATLTGGFNVTSGTPVDVETPDLTIPKNFVLEDVFPNPFNPSTTIRFGLPERSSVKIEVYSVLGKLIATLAAQEMQHGFHQINWKADNVASGTYLVRMTAESVESGKTFTTSRKAVLLK